MVVYNDIYEALRKERYSEQLQQLSRKFVADVAEYLREKKKIVQSPADMFSDEVLKVQKQIENATSIFKELMLLRKKKILSLVFIASETGINKRDFENMLDFEKELFDKIIISIQEADKMMNAEFVNGFSDNHSDDLKMVLFLEDIEQLVGLDGSQIGPFKKDEIVNLPKQIADILISDKKAELVIDE
ncbi:MAG TPA: hypothetical protein P5277_03975 [Candidatus Paceibacterota bacterium]|nr:hypothetical protein [Candidatus Paceibacterota bacterium]